MRKIHVTPLFLAWPLLAAAACGLSGCAQSASASKTPSTLEVTASIQELMQSEVDPAADALWDSVATITSASGTEELQPRSDEDWKTVRHHAITLIEAANLLAMDGRKVAPAGKTIEDSHVAGILSAEKIQQAIDADRGAFLQRARALQVAGAQALAAIDARDAAALTIAGGHLDEACEQCHLKYWYPDARTPGAPAAP